MLTFLGKCIFPLHSYTSTSISISYMGLYNYKVCGVVVLGAAICNQSTEY